MWITNHGHISCSELKRNCLGGGTALAPTWGHRALLTFVGNQALQGDQLEVLLLLSVLFRRGLSIVRAGTSSDPQSKLAVHPVSLMFLLVTIKPRRLSNTPERFPVKIRGQLQDRRRGAEHLSETRQTCVRPRGRLNADQICLRLLTFDFMDD
ncbi:hypothetical protein BDP81DRAFT_18641 [Colletotrichum phormii]|uniref:Uncharacterized protein n=1 Tax=Colletotrichum phormii TaxID=359342 RepID=A0AAJ0A4D6_9PEZI|nr:uncharacterized protein BDP81DRAFT_18641 [Colletotrichum phormii]KAK1656263.1 hypothetical protein BDP81DRAFT_18641 [Colletotrichum phormii]